VGRIGFVFGGRLSISIGFDSAFVDGLWEGKEGEEKGASNQSYGNVVNVSPWMTDGD
jgi:hypothetical protein